MHMSVSYFTLSEIKTWKASKYLSSSRPRLIKSTEWEYEFEPCQYGGASRFFLSGPDHCKEIVRNCEPVMVERRDGSPCKLGPGEGFSGVG